MRSFGADLYRRSVRELFTHPLLVMSLVVLIPLLVGTLGYMLIERWPLIDALYMTIITISTIGYGEVKDLSPAGRVFTIGLIVVGVVMASYAITTAIELFSSKEFMAQIRQRRRRRLLKKIRDHCIICGFGRLGRNLAIELQAYESQMVVVDSSQEVIELCYQQGIPAILGDAADETILETAGIERAKSLVACVRTDADNVFIVLTARSMNPDLYLISRYNSDASIAKLKRAGANKMISPYAITGHRIAHLLVQPNVTQFLDGVLKFGDQQMRLEEYLICPNSPLAGLTLAEARVSVSVLAVSHPEQTVLSHATADTKLLAGAAVIVMGVDEDLKKFEKLAKGID